MWDACDAQHIRQCYAGVSERYVRWELAHGNESADTLALNRSLYLLLPDRYGNGSAIERFGPSITKMSNGTATIGIVGDCSCQNATCYY